MGLQSVASGLHGSPVGHYSRVARSRDNPQSYAKTAESPNCPLLRRATSHLASPQLFSCKLPARGGFDEVRGVFILAKRHLRFHAKDRAATGFQQWKKLATVLAIVEFRQLFPH